MIECSPYKVAAGVLAELDAQLASTRAGSVDRLAVYPHPDPVIEFCPSMAWVGFRQIAMPPNQAAAKCAAVQQLEMTVGVQRCYPVTADNGAPPAVYVDSASRDIIDDLEAMRRAVADALEGQTWTIGAWRPVPPQGGSHGSRLDVTVDVGLGVFVEQAVPMLPGDPRWSGDGDGDDG